MENIDKMIHCGDPSFGGAMYGCPHCGNLNLFLSAVIAVSALPAATNIPWIALPVCPLSWLMSHIAIVFFTIDENLREFFLKDRSLLDCLFHSVNSVITRMFFKMNKSKNFTPGFIMVLHTFGRFEMESTYPLPHI